MAKNRSAIKRMRLAEIRRKRNMSCKSMLKTAYRKFEEALAGNDEATVKTAFDKAMRLVDKVASRGGVLHPNKRDRKKAQLAKAYNEYQLKQEKAG